uniref:Pseudouridine synthase RsuA/RluA-like domain-containing protein n=1 Tax=Callithrix jacchus TaxID=9483 RepID=A0A8I3WBA6_CALJA
MFMCICFRTSSDTEQATGSSSDRYGQGMWEGNAVEGDFSSLRVGKVKVWPPVFFLSYFPGKPGELTLLSVLPELSQSLGLGDRELQVVRASGKETSGLVLLSSCPQMTSRLQKFFIHARRAQRPTATYCAVTNGIPATSEGKIQTALKLEHIDGVNLSVLVKAPSRKDILEGVKKTQPLSCVGYRLWLCPGPAAAADKSICHLSLSGWITMSGVQDPPGQDGETLSLLKATKTSWAW